MDISGKLALTALMFFVAAIMVGIINDNDSLLIQKICLFAIIATLFTMLTAGLIAIWGS